MSKSNYAETLTLDYLLTANAVTRPSALYVALHTADPTETGAVAEIAAGNGYARQPVTFDNAAQPYVNMAAVEFGPNTVANWGTATHFSIWTAPTGGNCLYYGALSAPVVMAVTDTFKFAAGAIAVTAD